MVITMITLYFAGMAENKGYTGDEGGLEEEMKIAKERKEDDQHGGGQSDKKEADPDLKDSDADFEDLEQEGGGGNALGDGLERLWTGLGGLLSRYSRWMVNLYYRIQLHAILFIIINRVVKALTLLLAVVGYNCYFVAAIWWGISNNEQLDYCDDVGFLIIITVFLYIFLFYFLVVKRFLGGALKRAVLEPALLRKDKLLSHRHRFLFLLLSSSLHLLSAPFSARLSYPSVWWQR